MVQSQDYEVDASKLLNQVLSIFFGSPKMCVVIVMKDNAFPIEFWSLSFDCLA